MPSKVPLNPHDWFVPHAVEVLWAEGNGIGVSWPSPWVLPFPGSLNAGSGYGRVFAGVPMTLPRSMAETRDKARFSLVSGQVTAYVCAAPSPKSGSYADP